MPNPAKDYLQQHFLVEIINVSWQEVDVHIFGAWSWRNVGGGFPEHELVGIATANGANWPSYVDGWEFTGSPPLFNQFGTGEEGNTEEDYTVVGSVSVTGPTELTFGFGTQAFVNLEGIGDPGDILLQGVGAGSVGPFPVTGKALDGIPQYYGNIGEETKIYGFGDLGPSGHGSISISWTDFTVTHEPSGTVFVMERYEFSHQVTGIFVSSLRLDLFFKREGE